MGGDDVVLQIEVPPELFAAYKLPTPAAGLALRPLVDLLGRIETPARIGVHLCLGDFHNEAIVHPKALDKMAAFSIGMIERWPARHTLDFVHVPLAERTLTIAVLLIAIVQIVVSRPRAPNEEAEV